jgi:hypothetical protein
MLAYCIIGILLILEQEELCIAYSAKAPNRSIHQSAKQVCIQEKALLFSRWRAVKTIA